MTAVAVVKICIVETFLDRNLYEDVSPGGFTRLLLEAGPVLFVAGVEVVLAVIEVLEWIDVETRCPCGHSSCCDLRYHQRPPVGRVGR